MNQLDQNLSSASASSQNTGTETFASRKLITASTLALGVFALVTMGFVFFFYFGTQERISISQTQFERGVLEEIAGTSNSNFIAKSWMIQGQQVEGYLIQTRSGDETLGLVLGGYSEEGYSGRIDFLAAFDLQPKIIAVGITAHKETPGLGDKIEASKSDWIGQFAGHSLSITDWRLAKEGGDFDSLSGATISARAVVDGVRESLLAAQIILEQELADSSP